MSRGDHPHMEHSRMRARATCFNARIQAASTARQTGQMDERDTLAAKGTENRGRGRPETATFHICIGVGRQPGSHPPPPKPQQGPTRPPKPVRTSAENNLDIKRMRFSHQCWRHRSPHRCRSRCWRHQSPHRCRSLGHHRSPHCSPLHRSRRTQILPRSWHQRMPSWTQTTQSLPSRKSPRKRTRWKTQPLTRPVCQTSCRRYRSRRRRRRRRATVQPHSLPQPPPPARWPPPHAPGGGAGPPPSETR